MQVPRNASHVTIIWEGRTEPQGMSHYSFTKDESVVLQIFAIVREG